MGCDLRTDLPHEIERIDRFLQAGQAAQSRRQRGRIVARGENHRHTLTVEVVTGKRLARARAQPVREHPLEQLRTEAAVPGRVRRDVRTLFVPREL